VIGNPPYVRQELIPDVLMAEYRRRFATIYDRADIYVPFIERSLSVLAPGGCLGFICADRRDTTAGAIGRVRRAVAGSCVGAARTDPIRRLCRIHVRALHMIWKSDRGSRGYHHGNLKEALIRAALELIAAKGPSGFTFAEAARSAGVSPAAPYRHFRDREELLANVARRGFEQFEAALKAAWKDGVPNPFSAFERLGRAYLEFARTEPAYYSAMFEGGVPLEVSQELRDAGERAFAVIRSAAERLVAQIPAA
jgi:AcrR family transcriptional regulator